MFLYKYIRFISIDVCAHPKCIFIMYVYKNSCVKSSILFIERVQMSNDLNFKKTTTTKPNEHQQQIIFIFYS